jgi:hypothetical protein
VTAGETYLVGHHEGCKVMERLCEMKALPHDNPHGPENDHRPGNAATRMTVQVATSASDTGMSAITRGLDIRAFPKLMDT